MLWQQKTRLLPSPENVKFWVISRWNSIRRDVLLSCFTSKSMQSLFFSCQIQLWDSNSNNISVVWCWTPFLKVSRNFFQTFSSWWENQFCPHHCPSMSWREGAKKTQVFCSSTMLRASPQAPLLCLESPWGQYSPNLLGLATLTSQWGWTQFRCESITQTFGEGGCFVPGKTWFPSMHPCLPLQIIALKVANHPS